MFFIDPFEGFTGSGYSWTSPGEGYLMLQWGHNQEWQSFDGAAWRDGALPFFFQGEWTHRNNSFTPRQEEWLASNTRLQSKEQDTDWAGNAFVEWQSVYGAAWFGSLPTEVQSKSEQGASVRVAFTHLVSSSCSGLIARDLRFTVNARGVTGIIGNTGFPDIGLTGLLPDNPYFAYPEFKSWSFYGGQTYFDVDVAFSAPSVSARTVLYFYGAVAFANMRLAGFTGAEAVLATEGLDLNAHAFPGKLYTIDSAFKRMAVEAHAPKPHIAQGDIWFANPNMAMHFLTGITAQGDVIIPVWGTQIEVSILPPIIVSAALANATMTAGLEHHYLHKLQSGFAIPNLLSQLTISYDFEYTVQYERFPEWLSWF